MAILHHLFIDFSSIFYHFSIVFIMFLSFSKTFHHVVHAFSSFFWGGAVILAVGESMTLLGEKSWYCSNDLVIPFKGGSISSLSV